MSSSPRHFLKWTKISVPLKNFVGPLRKGCFDVSIHGTVCKRNVSSWLKGRTGIKRRVCNTCVYCSKLIRSSASSFTRNSFGNHLCDSYGNFLSNGRGIARSLEERSPMIDRLASGTWLARYSSKLSARTLKRIVQYPGPRWTKFGEQQRKWHNFETRLRAAEFRQRPVKSASFPAERKFQPTRSFYREHAPSEDKRSSFWDYVKRRTADFFTRFLSAKFYATI